MMLSTWFMSETKLMKHLQATGKSTHHDYHDLGILEFVLLENIIDFWDGGDVLDFFPSFFYPYCMYSFKCFFPSQGRTMFHWTRILCIFCQRVGSKQSDFTVQGNTILINCNDKEFNTLKQLFKIECFNASIVFRSLLVFCFHGYILP